MRHYAFKLSERGCIHSNFENKAAECNWLNVIYRNGNACSLLAALMPFDHINWMVRNVTREEVFKGSCP